MRGSRSRNVDYADFLYERLQRNGFLFRDCQRLANNDRNVFAACMVALGDADAMVTGVTRNYSTVLDNVRRAIDPKPGHRVIGVSIVLAAGRTVFIADTSIHEMPTAEELADIAEEAAGVARRLGYEPRVAFLSYSTFGYPRGERAQNMCARRSRSSTSAVSISSMTARWRPTSRSPRGDGALSVLPPLRPGQRAGHAGLRTRPRSRPRCCSNSAARR